MGLTWLAYKGNGVAGRYNFPNAGRDWTITEVYEYGSFRAIVATGLKKVLAFSGTDDGWDWGDNASQELLSFSTQYDNASLLTASVKPEVVVGHSLGGGLAAYSSVYRRVPAATINAAPLHARTRVVSAVSGSGSIINYVVSGEILDLYDMQSIQSNKIGRIVYVGTNAGMNPIDRHAVGLLTGFVQPRRLGN
jgi:hypothetical protein